ncbi:phage protease [Knoellia koreensis]|uniref:Uncharacterized protein n=1 Tax=Knoellia koreensis TaxID=2730921 RepID=A0A849HFH2_9MICO|nr:phage protease [Knoellia sp. DB2414S]NNM46012.1 hypothetical protein [Knoellia sp. DB2414S]
MSISKPVKIAAVGGVVALATGIGASQALAAGSTPSPSATSSASPSTAPEQSGGSATTDQEGRSPGGPGGPGRGGHGRGMDAAALASALGLSESKVQTALDSVREQLKPSSPPAQGTKPTEADRAAHEKAEVAALAKALGVSEAKVQAALDKVQAAQKTERRTDLSTRLDTAVKDGKLSAADKESVLKAFDAGVLGGGPR